VQIPKYTVPRLRVSSKSVLEWQVLGSAFWSVVKNRLSLGSAMYTYLFGCGSRVYAGFGQPCFRTTSSAIHQH